MTDKPNYTRHTWGTSLPLTPHGCDQEVVLGCFHNPRVYSSVHLHRFKDNRIICNSGRIQVDVFPWGVSEDDIGNGKVEDSYFDTLILCPNEDVLIPANMFHRLCSLTRLSMMTEIYTRDDGMFPYPSDIDRVIPAGQEWGGELYADDDVELLLAGV